MTIETDVLTSLDRSTHLAMTSPFSFPQSLPNHHRYMDAPTSPLPQTYHPGSLFDGFNFSRSTDNPEPPIQIPMNERMRSQSASQSQVDKAASCRARPIRKLSMTDARPPSASQSSQSRGRSMHSARPVSGNNHLRTLSQSDMLSGRMGLGFGLDTHKEGERTDSVTPPELGMNGIYGISVPRPTAGETASWDSAGSAPSLQPGSLGSYGRNNDEVIMDR